MSADDIVPLGSRAEFLDAVRNAFTRAEQHGARQIVLVDPNFADWPLNERSVIDALSRWVDSSRLLVVMAHSFDELARRQLRFVEWRRQWAHVVQCRTDPDLEAEQIPTLLLVAGHSCVRVVDRIRFRGTVSNRPVDLTESRDTVDALLQRSVEAFPVTTLGL
jgi:sugar/nucleoside kinase (ribokinase family)